jgi:hypothetical protein
MSDELIARLRPTDGTWVRQLHDGRLRCDDAVGDAADALTALQAKADTLAEALVDIRDAYDCRSELFRSDEDVAESLADRARAALTAYRTTP